jgi:hypothetical protein
VIRLFGVRWRVRFGLGSLFLAFGIPFSISVIRIGSKYRAWEHHLAFTILASWFIAETRLDWEIEHPRDPALLDQYATDILPALSVANVRSMLRATLPLPQLSSQQAALLVVKHLDNRTRSRSSRLKRRFKP